MDLHDGDMIENSGRNRFKFPSIRNSPDLCTASLSTFQQCAAIEMPCEPMTATCATNFSSLGSRKALKIILPSSVPEDARLNFL